jgi:glycosyltransferase involved in cell wall biosynthesis
LVQVFKSLYEKRSKIINCLISNYIIKIKILIVSSGDFFSTFGGGQTYVKTIVEEFIIRDFNIVLISNGKADLQNPHEYKSCKLYYLDENPEIKDVYNLLTVCKPDIVHAHGFKKIFSVVCKKSNIPCVITAHHGGILCPSGSLMNYKDELCNIPVSDSNCLPCVLKNIRGGYYLWPLLKIIPLFIRLKIGRFIQKLPFILFITPVLKASLTIQQKADDWKSIHENASVIIAPSNAIAKSMILNGAKPEKLKVIPHGIPLPDLKLLHKNQDDSKTVKFFYVGRICYIKGIHIMLAAYKKLKINAELHIIGSAVSKGDNRYLNRLLRKYRSISSIYWHGKIKNEEIYETISKYDIMIHPTICLEVFGLNIAEALAMNKPVIATKCGGAEMQITEGVNGRLVKPNDVEDLRKVMEITGTQELNLFKSKINSISEHIAELNKIYEKNAD